MRILLPALLLLATPVAARPWAAAPGDFENAVAQVKRLDAELLSRDSATATLQLWCDTHGSGGGARIVARRPAVDPKPAGEAERRDLGVGPDEPVAYRRVDLACGDKVLSRADNWYLPGRLTPEMNTALNTTQTPFGVVVRPLGFRRRTLSSALLIQSNPASGAKPAIPPEVLQHRAVLSTPDGAPFSLVVETYSDQVLVARP
ncbi:hypothetical protein [Phenylobacterium sp.]|uniref:hypothetical protein n=1 Tax=Phenylobacterium sp. TaxID=1871053 RepID=UPI002737C8DA|nr:hypothetical protein [Phenylobacterium sp.]MDP3870937.1 hypothetical protein [Phenylobacterium sp.]